MYTHSAAYYDAIYSFKDYREETDELLKVIAGRMPEARTVLDVACGTGKHMELLGARFDVAGVDLDKNMVALANARIGEGRVTLGEMSTFDLGRTFDVVMCLFSSVGYLPTVEALGRTLRNFAKHTVDGGLVIVEPWLLPETFRERRVSADHAELDDLKICRMCVGRREGDIAVLPMHYMIATPEGVRTAFEEHRLRLFRHEEYVAAFEAAGLTVDYNAKGLTWRGLYVGVKS